MASDGVVMGTHGLGWRRDGHEWPLMEDDYPLMTPLMEDDYPLMTADDR